MEFEQMAVHDRVLNLRYDAPRALIASALRFQTFRKGIAPSSY